SENTSGSIRNKLSHVWQALTLGNLSLRNRILQPAHSSQHGDPREHIFSDRQIAYFSERAKGGVALCITETVAAARSAVGSFYHIVDVYNERCIPSMTALGEAVHEHGGRIMVQLASMGVHDKGRMFIDQNKPIWGASRIPSLMHNEMPLVMGPVEIKQLVHDFGQSAANVKRAGLDGVEIHGAHSYGLAQFLSPTYNKRTDAYGGSPTKRCKLVIEVAGQVREQVGDDFVVGLRLSWDEFLGPRGGITPEQSEEQLEVLTETGLFDFFDISAGGYHTIHLALPSMVGGEGEGWLEPFSKKAKEIVGERAKVFVVGKIRDLYKAEEILANGSADMIAMARQLLTDPYTVKKTQEGREHEIIRCNRCNECAGRLWEHRELICALNPVSGREAYWGDGSLQKVAESERRQILIVGGGPAGMKAGAVAARRGHSVTLVERRERLGGHLRMLECLPSMSDWSIAIDNLEREVENCGVEVRLETEADIDMLRAVNASAVVIATGASYEKTGLSLYRPDREGIPGAELNHVFDVGTATASALDDPKILGKRVLILDESGAHLPFALAEILAKVGVAVEIMSPRMYAGERIYRNLDMLYIFPRLKQLGVRITHQHFIEAIRTGEVDVYDIWAGAEALETRTGIDSVVLSILRVPNDDLYFEAQASFPDVSRIGDVAAPRDVAAVLVDGETLGRAL
ncbi:MAG: FAD-dependent oxidoreductase, partial [Proteobacteria bacterium]|nr:FAD-dependent oxidoreductase [Pseudomonadota bacterium]